MLSSQSTVFLQLLLSLFPVVADRRRCGYDSIKHFDVLAVYCFRSIFINLQSGGDLSLVFSPVGSPLLVLPLMLVNGYQRISDFIVREIVLVSI